MRPGSGRPLVLVFHAQNVAFAGDWLNGDVRVRYSPPGELMVASVVDLSLVSPVFRPRPAWRSICRTGRRWLLCHARPTRRTTS